MEKKALFLDMDGTTLNDQVEIPKENLEAMKAALKAGHEIVVTTGRPTASTRKLLEQWGLDKIGCRYVISFNGGMVLDAISGDIIYEKTIPVNWLPMKQSSEVSMYTLMKGTMCCPVRTVMNIVLM